VPAKSALFGTADADESGDDKLHDLYWNRVKLKQDFARKADENFRLQSMIRDQEGATARVQQKLNHLENLLLDPEWVYNVAVFYQLRGLNAQCCRKIAKFAEQLKQQREQRQHKQALVTWNEARKAESAEVEARVGELRGRMQLLEDRLLEERQRLESMSGLGRMLRGRRTSAELDELETRLEVLAADEQGLLTELEAIRTRKPPGVAGLDVAAKRSINLMIIAFAQDVFLRFNDRNFVSMVKESSEKSAGAIKYGSKADCDKLLEDVQKQSARLEQSVDVADMLKKRVARIAEHADFSDDDDAVPKAATVATLFAFDAGGAVRSSDGNLLGEDYWQLSQVLCR